MLFDYYIFVTFCTDDGFWKKYQESVAKSVSLVIIVILVTCGLVFAWNIVGRGAIQ